MNSKQKIIVLLGIMLLVMPLIASTGEAFAYSRFENPLGTGMTFTTFLKNLILFILGLAGLIALLAITYGGIIIILGGMKSEQDLKRGKEIIFWALMGLLIIGVSATILKSIKGILF